MTNFSSKTVKWRCQLKGQQKGRLRTCEDHVKIINSSSHKVLSRCLLKVINKNTKKTIQRLSTVHIKLYQDVSPKLKISFPEQTSLFESFESRQSFWRQIDFFRRRSLLYESNPPFKFEPNVLQSFPRLRSHGRCRLRFHRIQVVITIIGSILFIIIFNSVRLGLVNQ